MLQEALIDKDQWKLAANGMLELLEPLVDKGADINAKDPSGITPLVRHCVGGSCSYLNTAVLYSVIRCHDDSNNTR